MLRLGAPVHVHGSLIRMRYVFEKVLDGCTGAGPNMDFGPAPVHPSAAFSNTYLIRDAWTYSDAPYPTIQSDL